MKVEKLICAVQNYDWGRVGSSSAVAALKSAAERDFVVDEGKPYAELWMGVHGNGPSLLASSRLPLSEHIAQNSSSVGAHEHNTLQFLFKVLSVNKALSIQSHPDKAKAELLHARDPQHYPDANHKPELAIALNDFQLLCGFRKSDEIFNNLKETSELSALIDDKHAVEQLQSSDDLQRRDALRRIFADYMKCAPNKLSAAIANLIARLSNKSERSDVENLIIRLNSEFPGDVGVFSPLFLNYFTLKKGEAVFLGPNQPHAYLSGDCMECMACSDNTVRAGLTPKFKDVDTLCSDLTFEMSPPPRFPPSHSAPSIVDYSPPVSEFVVQKLSKGLTSLPDVQASSIVIVIGGNVRLQPSEGDAVNATRGDVLFIPADAGTLTADVSDDFDAYRAFTPSQ